jgi:hypothetical protein
MLYDPKFARHHDPLEDSLRAAPAITPELMREVIAQACVRLPALSADTKSRIDRLIAAGAWTDAALALLELELPQWTLRRLVCEDGEWLCTLSRQPALPIELDEAAEANHPVLSLAILSALIGARRDASAPNLTSVPNVRPTQSNAVCCDNFA